MPFPSHRQSERIERESDESQAKFGAETSLPPLARGPRPPTTTIDLCLHCDCEKAGKFTFGWWNEGEGGRGQIQFALICPFYQKEVCISVKPVCVNI